MAKTSTIRASDIQLDGDVTLWDVMRATLREKETRPDSSILPTILILKSQHIVAQVNQSREEPRTLLVRTAIGIRKINLNWYDVLLMLYRTSILTLQKMEGSAVIFLVSVQRMPEIWSSMRRSGRPCNSCSSPRAVHISLKPTTAYVSDSVSTMRRSTGYRK